MSGGILGTGIDIVETQRMRETLRRWGPKFKDRVFLVKEQQYCDGRPVPCRHYAGRFAVKEAVSKAFGTGVGPSLGWLDIEVVRDAGTGAPSVRMRGRARAFAKARGVSRVLVSLSHTRQYAVAQALLLGKEPR
jgi:holo-[acyl-carrier protein] synthase